MRYLLIIFLFIRIETTANDVKLLITCESGNLVSAGNTYRLYAAIPADATLHVVYGDPQYPLSISCDQGFYQHPMGSNTTAGIHPTLTIEYPELLSDSWITIGYENQWQNQLWDIGLDLNTFSEGGNIFCDNGGWFLVPGDIGSLPDERGLVLLAQFTTLGSVSGTLNLQGRNADGVWKKNGLTFSSEDCLIAGCTDSQFANFNPLAEINDGSCSGGCLPEINSNEASSQAWTIFPNPLRQHLLHIQFNAFQFTSTESAKIEIRDASGKLILSRTIDSQQIQFNRFTIEHTLSSGTYEVLLMQGELMDHRKLVVQH